MPWGSWLNAEIYDRFVRERRIYDWLNRRLVELADLGGAVRVLDLACGTGATTAACLREMPASAEIVGVDASEEMIGVARANAHDPRARFSVLAAAEADRLEGVFDRVVCNAAFWQFPAAAPVLAALARKTEPAATVVLNVPAERVVGEPAPIHPFQVTLMQEIRAATGRAFEGAAASFDPDQFRMMASEAGFTLAKSERRVYEGRQDELIDLMSIPAMILPLTSELSDERREALLARARENSDATERVLVPWVYFILSRCPS